MKEDPSKDIKSNPISPLDGKYDNHDYSNNMRYKSIQLLGSLLHTGAPNENIVQNHLNIALLNVF